jgi:hypothetical protein
MSTVIRALEGAWHAIRGRHPLLPETVIVVGPGRCGQREIWGHFAWGRWRNKGGRRFHEILIAGESFRRPPVETMGTLLHEAAHCLAAARRDAAPPAEQKKLADTSRQGRYHNEVYRRTAEECGLIVSRHKVIGWSLTEVPDGTAALYRDAIKGIGDAQGSLFRQEILIKDEKKKPSRLSARCQCPRTINMTPAAFREAPIKCMGCLSLFAEVGDNDES